MIAIAAKFRVEWSEHARKRLQQRFPGVRVEDIDPQAIIDAATFFAPRRCVCRIGRCELVVAVNSRTNTVIVITAAKTKIRGKFPRGRRGRTEQVEQGG